jgi:RNA polymerase sigma factor (sigma-70 family)
MVGLPQPAIAMDDLSPGITGSEALLIARAKRDPAAFAPLYEMYFNAVYRYCHARLRDGQAAEDAASQIFTNALAALPRYRADERPGAFRSWLFTIAHNVVANHDRSRGRCPLAPLADAGNLPDAVPSAEDQAVAAEARQTIHTVLEHLTDEQHQVVEPRLAGLTDAEEGEFLEIWGTTGSGEGSSTSSWAGLATERRSGTRTTPFTWLTRATPHSEVCIRSVVDRGMGRRRDGVGQFMGLNDLALDQEGWLFATDGGRDDIQVFDRDGRFLDAWGGTGTGAGQFMAPSGIAIDGDGELYISEYEGLRIQKLTPDGAPLAVWGSYGTEAGAFMNPEDVILDTQGRVFVTEWSNHRVQVFDPDGRFLATWGSAAGIRDGPLANPSGAALDGKGFIYASDGGSDTVFKFRLMPPLAPE